MNPINLKSVIKRYKNCWVALKPNTDDVVASGKTLKEVLAKSKKKGVANPAVFKPSSTQYLYVG